MDQGKVCGSAEQENDKGDKVQAGQGLGQAFIIAYEPPEARHPGEAAVDDPAAR
jgi:hypothetical protein